jgi:hypothetical protein
MCESAEELAEHADVLVIGTDGPDAEALCALARPDQVIVDLTRTARSKVSSAAEAA